MVDYLAYRRGTLARSDLESELNKLLQEIPNEPILRHLCTEAGLDPEQIMADHPVISVSSRGMGVDVGTMLIIGLVGSTVGGVSSGLILDFIRSYLIPVIRERRGQDAIRDATPNDGG